MKYLFIYASIPHISLPTESFSFRIMELSIIMEKSLQAKCEINFVHYTIYHTILSHGYEIRTYCRCMLNPMWDQ